MEIWNNIRNIFTARDEDERENSGYILLLEEEFYEKVKPGSVFEINVVGLPTIVKLIGFNTCCSYNNKINEALKKTPHKDFVLAARCKHEKGKCHLDLIVEVIEGEPLKDINICGRDTKELTISIKPIHLTASTAIQSTQNY